MILHASGTNATIDLFEHHLAINRRQRGVLFDGPDAEHMIPLSSIKSVQFFRPGFMSPGKIVLVLAAGAAAGQGTPSDPNTVYFSKRQLVPFENLLRAIQAAIATPSIERLAMAAQQKRSIDNYQPSPNSEGLRRIEPPAGTTAQPGPADRPGAYSPQSGTNTHSAQRSSGGWWRDMPRLGKIILIGVACFVLLNMCSPDSTVPDDSEQSASGEATSSAESAESSADQMLADWSAFVTGDPDGGQFAITDGTGKPGEFCNGSDGKVGMQFGRILSGEGLRIADYLYWSDVERSTSYIGAFSFDPSTKRLSALRLMEMRTGSEQGEPAPNVSMPVEQISPGIVSVDGTQFHTCIL